MMTVYVMDLSSGDCDHGFLDLRDGIVGRKIELDMGNVGQLVGRNDAIDDRGAVDCKSFGDRAMQFVWVPCPESMAPACASQGDKIRIRKFDSLPKSRQTHTFSLQKNESKAGIIVNDDLHRQLVVYGRKELAHQHVETTITAKGDDLARAIQGLDAVRLT